MEELTRAAPQVQAEYQNLNRDYNILQKTYEDLLGRRESSNVTAAADAGADKVRLRIIDPPKVPLTPVAPNRPMLLSVVLLAALAAGAGLPILWSQVDQSVNEMGRLRDFGRPVLGGISLVPNLVSRPRLYSQGMSVGVSMALLLVVYAGLATGKITHPPIVF
jgi:hypothetical protein